jgi:hypothetical protein
MNLRPDKDMLEAAYQFGRLAQWVQMSSATEGGGAEDSPTA